MTSTVVMTGATSGIGRAAAERLMAVSVETHLVVLARNATAPAAIDLLRRFGARLRVIETDLLSIRSVVDAATVAGRMIDDGDLPPLRGIAANAGAQYTSALTRSVDGFEATFATNVLAPHALIRRLRPRLQRGRSRVVVTVSDTHFGDLRHNLGMVPGPQWRDPAVLARPGAFPVPDSTRAGRTAYSTSKLAAIHLVHEYARRMPGVETVGFNPGFVPGTGLVRGAGPVSRLAMRWLLPTLALGPLATRPRQAGALLADAILGTTPAPSGGYIDRDRASASSPESYDPERELELWEAVEHLIDDLS